MFLHLESLHQGGVDIGVYGPPEGVAARSSDLAGGGIRKVRDRGRREIIHSVALFRYSSRISVTREVGPRRCLNARGVALGADRKRSSAFPGNDGAEVPASDQRIGPMRHRPAQRFPASDG